MKILISSFLLFISILGFSQNRLFPSFKSGKWGAVNQKSEIIIDFKYNDLYVERNFALAMEGNKYGIIDSLGTQITNFKYDKIEFISQEFAFLYHGDLIYLFNAQNHSISASSKKKDYKYLRANVYSLITEDSLKILNTFTNKIYSFKADTISYLIQNKSSGGSMMDFFTDESAFYYIGSGGLWGIISDDYRQLTPIKYTNISIQKTHFKVSINALDGYVDFTGKEVIPCKYDRITFIDSFYYVKKDNLFGLLNSDCKTILDCKYNECSVIGNDLIIYTKGDYDGTCNFNGRMIIPANRFSHIRPIDSQYLEYRLNGKSGIMTYSGQIVNASNFDYVSRAYSFAGKKGVGYIIEKNSKGGFLSNNLQEVYKPQFDNIIVLNDKYLKIRRNHLNGVVSIHGKSIIPPVYNNIEATDFQEIFFLKSTNFELLSGNDIQEMLGFDIPNGKDKRAWKTHRYGIANSKGELLLDTTYFKHQISFDYENYVIKVKTDSAVMVISYDDDGTFLDKVYYKNYIDVKVRNFSLEHIWKINPKRQNDYWGLVTNRGTLLIDYSFSGIKGNLLNNSDLYLTQKSMKKSALDLIVETRNDKKIIETRSLYLRYGIVDKPKAKELLSCSYMAMDTLDFKYAQVARCVTLSNKFDMINYSGKKVGKRYSYIDDFQDTLARVNTKGKLQLTRNETYNLFVPNYKSEGIDIYSGSTYLMACLGGKWGLIDTLGIEVMTPKYDFLQKKYRNEYIAQLDKKWGVIYSNDSVKIDFLFDEIRYFYDRSKENEWSKQKIYKIRKGKNWGVADNFGNILIEPEYQDVELMDNEKGLFFSVKKNNKWGLVDENNLLIIPIQFDEVSYLSQENKMLFKVKNEKSFAGFIDRKGNFIAHEYYYKARNFKNNYAAVAFAEGECNFINKDFKSISKRNFLETRDFSNHRAAVFTQSGWGFIDESGEAICPFYFNEVSDFYQNRAMVDFTSEAKFFGLIKAKTAQGFINEKGQIVVKPKYKTASNYNHSAVIISDKNKNYGLLDLNGDELLKPKYRSISEFSENAAAIVQAKNKELAVIDTLGNFIVPFGKYLKIEEFKDGMALVKLGSKYGFINEKGEEVIKAEYKDAEDFSEGMAAVKKVKYWQYINKNGELLPQEYRKVAAFENSYAYVSDKKYVKYYIDTLGNKISAKPLIDTDGIFIKKTVNSEFVFCDSLGNDIFNKRFQSVTKFNEGISVVENNNLFGLFRSNGEVLVSPVCNSITNFFENYALYYLNTQYGLFSSDGKELAKTRFYKIESAGKEFVRFTDFNETVFKKFE